MEKQSLHTDSLESRFGTVYGRVLQHNDARRVIDIVDEKGITRTHAVTWFIENNGSVNHELNKEIEKGMLLGKTFRKYGYDVKKHIIFTGGISLPEWLKQKFVTETDKASICIYEFWGIKPSEQLLYGIVTEIYSPDFIDIRGENPMIAKVNSSNVTDEREIKRLFINYVESTE